MNKTKTQKRQKTETRIKRIPQHQYRIASRKNNKIKKAAATATNRALTSLIQHKIS